MVPWNSVLSFVQDPIDIPRYFCIHPGDVRKGTADTPRYDTVQMPTVNALILTAHEWSAAVSL